MTFTADKRCASIDVDLNSPCEYRLKILRMLMSRSVDTARTEWWDDAKPVTSLFRDDIFIDTALISSPDQKDKLVARLTEHSPHYPWNRMVRRQGRIRDNNFLLRLADLNLIKALDLLKSISQWTKVINTDITIDVAATIDPTTSTSYSSPTWKIHQRRHDHGNNCIVFNLKHQAKHPFVNKWKVYNKLVNSFENKSTQARFADPLWRWIRCARPFWHTSAVLQQGLTRVELNVKRFPSLLGILGFMDCIFKELIQLEMLVSVPIKTQWQRYCARLTSSTVLVERVDNGFATLMARSYNSLTRKIVGVRTRRRRVDGITVDQPFTEQELCSFICHYAIPMKPIHIYLISRIGDTCTWRVYAKSAMVHRNKSPYMMFVPSTQKEITAKECERCGLDNLVGNIWFEQSNRVQTTLEFTPTTIEHNPLVHFKTKNKRLRRSFLERKSKKRKLERVYPFTLLHMHNSYTIENHAFHSRVARMPSRVLTIGTEYRVVNIGHCGSKLTLYVTDATTSQTSVVSMFGHTQWCSGQKFTILRMTKRFIKEYIII